MRPADHQRKSIKREGGEAGGRDRQRPERQEPSNLGGCQSVYATGALS
jgi:hypothetical protein